MLKRSKQRESIKKFLISRYDHPTAETVYMNIKEEFPNISLGTVYRNLSLLADIGEIQKLQESDLIVLTVIQNHITILSVKNVEAFWILM